MHHTIGPDLDTIRAVLNSTFRRFGFPPLFLSRSPPFATATVFHSQGMGHRSVCARIHRKRDNPFRVSQKLPRREILPNGFDSIRPSFFLFQRFFFFPLSCFFSSKKLGSHSQFPLVFRVKISSSSGSTCVCGHLSLNV